MKKSNLVILIIYLLILATVSSLISKELVDSLSIRRHYNIEGIKVVAKRKEQTIGSIKIKEFDPRISVPEVNIAQALQNMVGINLATGGKSGAEINIRGFQNDQIKVLLDGKPVSGGYFGNVDLQTIPLSEIKKIQLLKGPVSSLYGADTMGGVLNIISQTPNNKEWIKISTKFKRNNTNKFSLSTSRTFQYGDYWLYGSRYNTDGFMLSDKFEPTIFENGSVRDHTKLTQYDLQSKFNFSILDFHSLGLSAGYTFMDGKEIPSSIYENRVRKFTDWERYQFSIPLSLQLSYDLTSETNLYYDNYNNTYAEYNPTTGEMYAIWPSYLESYILGYFQKFEWLISEKITTNFGYRFEKQGYKRKDSGNYLNWTSNDQTTHNCFFQSDWKFNRFKLVFGSGFTMFSQSGREKWIHKIDPSASLNYKTEALWKHRLSISSNTKYPTLHQLFSSSSGNSALEEESAIKTEYTLHIPLLYNYFKGSIENSLFYNNIKGLIDKDDGIYQNIKKINSYGFEISGRFDLLLEHQIDFTHIEYAQKHNVELLETPENTFRLSEIYHWNKHTNFEYKARWKDIRLTDEGKILSSYWLHSFYVNTQLNRFNILFGLENIFDVNYQDKYGYPGAGFNFVIGIKTGI